MAMPDGADKQIIIDYLTREPTEWEAASEDCECALNPDHAIAEGDDYVRAYEFPVCQGCVNKLTCPSGGTMLPWPDE